jgi:hypothetical protein
MSKEELDQAIEHSEMLQALVKVAPFVLQDVIQKALQFNTPIITADEQGNILRLHPDDVLKRNALPQAPQHD